MWVTLIDIMYSVISKFSELKMQQPEVKKRLADLRALHLIRVELRQDIKLREGQRDMFHKEIEGLRIRHGL